LHEAQDLAPETAFQRQQWRCTKVHHGNHIDTARPTISNPATNWQNFVDDRDEVLLVEALIEARLLYRHLADDHRAITRALEKAVAAFCKEQTL
jgi:hypothetical protein